MTRAALVLLALGIGTAVLAGCTVGGLQGPTLATTSPAGVRCAAVAAYTDLGATVAAEVPVLEMQIAYVESLCRIGAKLGAGVATPSERGTRPGRDVKLAVVRW